MNDAGAATTTADAAACIASGTPRGIFDVSASTSSALNAISLTFPTQSDIVPANSALIPLVSPPIEATLTTIITY